MNTKQKRPWHECLATKCFVNDVDPCALILDLAEPVTSTETTTLGTASWAASTAVQDALSPTAGLTSSESLDPP